MEQPDAASLPPAPAAVMVGELFKPTVPLPEATDTEKLVSMLSCAKECSDRGLYQSAKW